MAGLVPFNRRNGNTGLMNVGTGFENFYNMFDDFFGDRNSLLPSRNLLHDTFKIDIEEKETEYLIEAELPGIQKDEIDLGIKDDNHLCIQINRTEESNKDGKTLSTESGVQVP